MVDVNAGNVRGAPSPARISIIVPTHGRPQQVADLLARLEELDYPRESFEVILVVDGGDPPAPDVLARARKAFGVIVVEQTNGGPGAARNAGARVSSGSWIAFTDDDCLPARDWLRVIDGAARSHPDAVVGGRIVGGVPDNLFTVTNHVIVDAMYGFYNANPLAATVFLTCNLALPASIFREVGGFDEWFRTAEDREFCDRCLDRGVRMIYVPDMVIHHVQRGRWRAFWRRHFDYGAGAHRFYALRAARASTSLRVAPSGFYSILLRAPFARGLTMRAVVVGSLLLVSQAATLAGFAWQGAKRSTYI